MSGYILSLFEDLENLPKDVGKVAQRKLLLNFKTFIYM